MTKGIFESFKIKANALQSKGAMMRAELEATGMATKREIQTQRGGTKSSKETDRAHKVDHMKGVFKGKKMAGHMGAVKTTTQNLEVIRVDNDRNLLLVKGAVPGSKGGNVIVSPAVKVR